MRRILKRGGVLLLAAALCACLSGCNILLGGAILSLLGEEFPDSTDYFEGTIELELPGGDACTSEKLYAYETAEGETLSLYSVSFSDSETENAVVGQILANDHWSAGALPSGLETLVCGQLPGKYCDLLTDVRDGYFFVVYAFPDDTWVYEAEDASAADWVFIGLFDSEQHRLYYLEYTPPGLPAAKEEAL